MSKKLIKKFAPKLFSCLIAAAMLLQLPAQLSANTVTTPAPSKKATKANLSQLAKSVVAGESEKIDGVILGDLETKDVNTFLASDSRRANFLSVMAQRGVNPDKVKYISVSDDGSDPNSDLAQLTQAVNREAVERCGGTRVASVEFWIGGYQHDDGTVDGEVLLVANLETGEQKVLAGFQADEEALNGAKDPVEVDGDFFASSDSRSSFGCPPQSILIIRCWIRCIVVQQILVFLVCVIRTILICVWTGQFWKCFILRIIQCRLIIIIRTFVHCYIVCFVQILRGSIQAPPGQPGGGGIAGVLKSPGEVFRTGLEEWLQTVVEKKGSSTRRTGIRLARSAI